ncbi:MAG: hypothetical protein ACXWRE_16220 [Pseudobdellovibrionaceae bacterium]
MTKKRHPTLVCALQIVIVFIVSALFSKACFVDSQATASSPQAQAQARAYALAIPQGAE